MLMMIFSCVLKTWGMHIEKVKNLGGEFTGKSQMIFWKVSNKYNYCLPMKIIAACSAHNNELYTAIWTNEEIGSMLLEKT